MQITDILSPNMNQIVEPRRVDLLVLHAMEAPEKGTTAEAVGYYFQREDVRASSHYGFDNNSICRYVMDNNVAWAAPGANHDGIQFEHAGFSAQTGAQWEDEYGMAMLQLSVVIAASVMQKYALPLKFCRAADLASGRRGITTHAEVSHAWHLTDHTDPGRGFPIDWYLHEIEKHVGNSHVPTTKPIPPTIKRGARGWRVKQAQRLLNAANTLKDANWDKMDTDGIFGTKTRRAVRMFQHWAGIKVDGIIGPLTWADLWQARYLGVVK